MADYPPLPRVPDLTQPAEVCVAWVIAAEHHEVIAFLAGHEVWYWPAVGELTTGCRCREAPGWYPGRPAAALCPLHGSHRRQCPGVPLLGRSRRMEGAGWRCPPCGATWVLTRVQGAEQPVRLYPTMQWIRDAPKQA